MQLELYYVEDADNVIGKDLGAAPLAIDIKLHRDFDITNPSLTLRSAAGMDFRDYNYFLIPDMERYYFIDSITNTGNSIWIINGHVDVLETYKDEILASNARFLRNLKTGDYAGAVDNEARTTISKHVSYKSLPAGETMLLTTVGS